MSKLIDFYADFIVRFDRGTASKLKERAATAKAVLESADDVIEGGLMATADHLSDADLERISTNCEHSMKECRTALRRFWYWRRGGLRISPETPRSGEPTSDR